MDLDTAEADDGALSARTTRLRRLFAAGRGGSGKLQIARLFARQLRPGASGTAAEPLGVALDELDGGRIFVRPGTSDIDNAIDYLSLGIYLPAPEVADRGMKRAAEFGSNIGAALTGLAHSFPNVDLLGVEPDPDNVRIARANVERFGERVVLVESAVWSEACDLVIEIEEGNEHGIVVRPSHDADPPGISVIPARPIDDLLSERWPNGDPVDYIHVTIEGSEPVVFDAPGDWPKRVGSLRVEVHPYFGYGQAECIAQLEKLGYRAWAAESPPGKWVFAVRD